MKLYYKPGACSLAAHIILIEAGAPYTVENVDTAEGRTEAGTDYKAINPRGYVPALELGDGTIITENAAVLQYIADRFPDGHFAPLADDIGRVRIQEDLSFLSSELHKAFSPFFASRDMSPAEKEAAMAKLTRQIGHFEDMLTRGGNSLNGPHFSVTDAYAFVILNWTNFIGVSLSAWPKTEAFVDRIKGRDAVRKALAEEGLPS